MKHYFLINLNHEKEKFIPLQLFYTETILASLSESQHGIKEKPKKSLKKLPATLEITAGHQIMAGLKRSIAGSNFLLPTIHILNLTTRLEDVSLLYIF